MFVSYEKLVRVLTVLTMGKDNAGVWRHELNRGVKTGSIVRYFGTSDHINIEKVHRTGGRGCAKTLVYWIISE
jgi:hypothetical protein